jgi:hypothetical protein
MTHFHITLPDDTPILRLLYYSTQLAEDINKAEIKREQDRQARATAPKMRTVRRIK